MCQTKTKVAVIGEFRAWGGRQRWSSIPQRAAAPAQTAEPEGTKQAMKLPSIVTIQVTDPLMAAVYALRREVFVVEQHIPQELEADDDDKIATHCCRTPGWSRHRNVAHCGSRSNSQDR